MQYQEFQTGQWKAPLKTRLPSFPPRKDGSLNSTDRVTLRLHRGRITSKAQHEKWRTKKSGRRVNISGVRQFRATALFSSELQCYSTWMLSKTILLERFVAPFQTMWWYSLRILKARLHGEFQPGLKFQPGWPGWNFSPASQTNPLKIKLAITWRGIQPGAQFSPGWKS